MYAIVKTGGKQYRVAAGDMLNVEKIPGEVGDKITLDTICVVDGKKVEADPKNASATKVEAEVVEQFKDKKILVFKFKKRKNYKRLQGHRQNLTRIKITAVGSDKATATKASTKAKPKAKAEKAEKVEKAEKTVAADDATKE